MTWIGIEHKIIFYLLQTILRPQYTMHYYYCLMEFYMGLSIFVKVIGERKDMVNTQGGLFWQYTPGGISGRSLQTSTDVA
jgi:hypothetical protein